MQLDISAARTGPHSSNLGKDIIFTGATLALAVNIYVDMELSMETRTLIAADSRPNQVLPARCVTSAF